VEKQIIYPYLLATETTTNLYQICCSLRNSLTRALTSTNFARNADPKGSRDLLGTPNSHHSRCVS